MRLGYLIRRLLFLVGVIWAAATLNFILPHLTGRDPIRERITQQIATMGLDPTGAQEMIDSYKRALWPGQAAVDAVCHVPGQHGAL